jgi:hypothetical protein
LPLRKELANDLLPRKWLVPRKKNLFSLKIVEKGLPTEKFPFKLELLAAERKKCVCEQSFIWNEI